MRQSPYRSIRRRLDSSLGMASPDEFEAAYYATLTGEPLPAQERQRIQGGSQPANRIG